MRTLLNRIGELRAGGDRGAAAVEFALVVPILLTLFFGIIDGARAYNAQITLSEAAAEGARALAVGGSAVQARAAANAALVGSSLSASSVSFPTVTVCPTGAGAGTTRAQITVAHDFTLLTPIVSTATGTFTIRGTGARSCAS